VGNILSLWRYDSRRCTAIRESAMLCDPALRLMGGRLPDFRGWSGYPSTAALSINPGNGVMCTTRDIPIDCDSLM
jgi:hypothetical protein